MNQIATVPSGAALTSLKNGPGNLLWTQVDTAGTGSGNLVFSDGYKATDLAIDAGTSEVDTLTIGGTPTGGTFTITYSGQTTGAITWSATTGTLLGNINTAVRALSNVGGTAITATAGTLSSGIGTILLTFSGALAAQPVSLMTADGTSLTGSSPTVAIAQTTAGVAPVTTKVTSSSHSFTSADVGLPLTITAGTGFTPGTYTIVSAAGNAATLSASAGAAGSTSGTYNVGSAQVLLQIPATVSINVINATTYPGIPYFTTLIATNVANGPVVTTVFN